MSQILSGNAFQRRLRNLILITWTIPPVFGLSYLVYLHLYTSSQVMAILLNPLLPTVNIIWIVLATWYLPRTLKPVSAYLDNPDSGDEKRIQNLFRQFPFVYAMFFIVYLFMSPTTVMLSAEHFAHYIATPLDWYRIHLVALVVSILVGLPIFFMVLNLFGEIAGRFHLHKPHVSIRTKVFLIGSLMPLLIDTMLVQYYWTRTGYFTLETFFVWLSLELLAIMGSLIFVRSIGQSLSPLQALIKKDTELTPEHLRDLVPRSTDELGVITSDYHQMLEELFRHRHALEDQVRTRTQELTTINLELEAFAYSVSHDLRAPLRSINGFAHILVDNYARDLDEDGREYLSRIVEASSRMSGIIDALLNLSRVTRSSLVREKVNLSEMSARILQAHSQTRHDRVVETIIQPDLIVNADRNLTQIMLENLLNNALKFTSKSSHALIKVGSTRHENETVFYVADNGVGFDMRFADKLFNAFQRLHPYTEFEGLGIGLATVQRIVNMHGGRIWAEASPGKGATFYFTL